MVFPQPGGDLVTAPELPLLAPTHRHLALGGSDESWSLVWLLLALGTGWIVVEKLMKFNPTHRPQFLQLGVKKGGGWERSWRETKLLKELLPS